MAKIENGILSEVKGKVGNVVGYVVKGQNVLRMYLKPTDKKSIPQLDYRDRVKFITTYGKHNYGNLVKPFMTKACEDQIYSPWNLFLRENVKQTDIRSNLNLLKISHGELPIPSLSYARNQLGGTTISIVWDPTVSGQGSGTDKIYLYRYKVGDPVIYRIDPDTLTRADGSLSLTSQDLDLWLNSAVLIVATNSDGLVSITDGVMKSSYIP